MKVWVLTGDKPDTSISIAFSCNLINHHFKLFELVNLQSKEEIINIITKGIDQIKDNPLKKYALIVATDELKLITSDGDLTNKVLVY